MISTDSEWQTTSCCCSMTIVLKDEPLKSLDPKKLSNPERDEIPPQLSKDEDERETQRYKRISFM